MFKFFKKKASVPSTIDILSLEDKAFVNAVSHMVTEGDLASGVMCLVANENLRPIMHATFTLAAQKPDQDLPTELDGFIGFLADGIEKQTDEIAKRRMQWFFLTSLIWRVNAKAAVTPSLIDPVAAIWLFLAKSGALLNETVKNNMLWDEKEKVWFDHIRTPEEGVSYVLVHMMPAIVKDHENIKAFADEQNIPSFSFLNRRS